MPKMSELINKAWLITHFAPQNLVIDYASITADDTIIAVDGGLKRCLELNLVPDIVIGDFDSIEPSYLQNLPHECQKLTYPSTKDETDTQLALQYCIEHQAKEVIICNELNGRFDHCLALVQNLLQALKHDIKASIVSSTQILTLFNQDTVFNHPVGSLLSLISITEQTIFVTSKGLQYPLDKLTLHNWDSRGVSNVFLEQEIKITIAQGIVLSIVTPV